MPRLSLGYPSLNLQGGSILGLAARAKAAYMKNLPRSRRAHRSGRSRRDSQLADVISVNKELREEEKFRYLKKRDQREDFVGERDFEFKVAQEARLQRKDTFNEGKEYADNLKSFTYKWIELVEKAQSSGNKALAENLHASGKLFFGGLNAQGQNLVGPLLKSGPFDPRAEKLRHWDKLNPRPEVTADPSEEPTLFATQVTDQENYRVDRIGFSTGKRPTANQIISFGEGNYVSTRNGGSIVNEESLNLQNLAKSEKTTVMKLLANQGVSTQERKLVVNGIEHRVVSKLDLEGNFSIEELGKKPTTERKGAYKFMQEWAVWDDIKSDEKKKLTNSLIGGVKKKLAEGVSMFEISSTELKPIFGTNFVLTGAKPDLTVVYKPWTWLSEGHSGYLKIVDGEAQRFNAPNGKSVVLYYDRINDRVHSADDGTYLGTYEETVERLRRASKGD